MLLRVVVTDESTASAADHPQSQVKSIRPVHLFYVWLFMCECLCVNVRLGKPEGYQYCSLHSEDDHRWGHRNVTHYHLQQSFSRLY